MSSPEITPEFRKLGRIYFVKPVGADGPIKIGFTTQAVHRRLKEIQIGSPSKLEIIGYFAGLLIHEHLLHQMFKAHRSHGEWFHAIPELRALAASHSAALTGDVHQAEIEGTVSQTSWDRENLLATVRRQAAAPERPKPLKPVVVPPQQAFSGYKRRSRRCR